MATSGMFDDLIPKNQGSGLFDDLIPKKKKQEAMPLAPVSRGREYVEPEKENPKAAKILAAAKAGQQKSRASREAREKAEYEAQRKHGAIPGENARPLAELAKNPNFNPSYPRGTNPSERAQMPEHPKGKDYVAQAQREARTKEKPLTDFASKVSEVIAAALEHSTPLPKPANEVRRGLLDVVNPLGGLGLLESDQHHLDVVNSVNPLNLTDKEMSLREKTGTAAGLVGMAVGGVKGVPKGIKKLSPDLGSVIDDALTHGAKTVMPEPVKPKFDTKVKPVDNVPRETILDYQGKNGVSGRAAGRGITIDRMHTELPKLAKNDAANVEAVNVIHAAIKNPSAPVKIYRATNGETINSGDWIFITKAQAERFTKTPMGSPKPGVKVVEMEVPASHVDWSGKNLEFVYTPEPPTTPVTPQSKPSKVAEQGKAASENILDTAKHADTGALREEIGLAPREKTKRTWDEANKNAEEMAGRIPDIIEEFKEKPRPLKDDETLALGHHTEDLLRQRADLEDKAIKGSAWAKQELKDLEPKIASAFDALEKGGSESGRSLAIRRKLLQTSHSEAALARKAQLAKEAGLSTDEHTIIRNMAKAIRDADAEGQQAIARAVDRALAKLERRKTFGADSAEKFRRYVTEELDPSDPRIDPMHDGFDPRFDRAVREVLGLRDEDGVHGHLEKLQEQAAIDAHAQEFSGFDRADVADILKHYKKRNFTKLFKGESTKYHAWRIGRTGYWEPTGLGLNHVLFDSLPDPLQQAYASWIREKGVPNGEYRFLDHETHTQSKDRKFFFNAHWDKPPKGAKTLEDVALGEGASNYNDKLLDAEAIVPIELLKDFISDYNLRSVGAKQKSSIALKLSKDEHEAAVRHLLEEPEDSGAPTQADKRRKDADARAARGELRRQIAGNKASIALAGKQNKLVTRDKYAEAKQRALGGPKGLSSGFVELPDRLAAVAEMALYHIERGVRTVAELAKAIKADVPNLSDLELHQAIQEAAQRHKRGLSSGKSYGADIIARGKHAMQDKEVIYARGKAEKLRREADAYVEKLAPKTKGEKAKAVVGAAYQLPRATMLSGDFGVILRQGLLQTITHPKRGTAALRKAVSSMKSDEMMLGHDRALKEMPEHAERVRSKLFLAEPYAKVNGAEEGFIGKSLGFAGKLASPIKGIERFQQAYLNQLRASVFDDFVKRFPEATASDRANVATYINFATGRGALPEKAAAFLGDTFTAPRYAVSRVQAPAQAGKMLVVGSKSQRSYMAKELGKQIAAIGTLYALGKAAGGQVATDIRDADAYKLRFGNTRVDILGGFQQAPVFLARYFSGKTSFEGKEKELNTGKFGSTTKKDVVERFVRSKAHPTIALFYDYSKGEFFDGAKFSAAEAAKRDLIPLSWQDIYESATEGQGAGKAIGALSLIGMGASTYEPRAKKPKTPKKTTSKPKSTYKHTRS